MAKAAQAEYFTTYTMDIRGHGASGMKGDIAYNGQLDDDLADFVAYLRKKAPDATLQLAGFSSGGAFALRTAGGSNGDLFDRYVLVSPALPYNAPTMRPNAGGWVQPFIPRIVGLTILDRFGIHTFEHLPVLAFAVDPLSSANPTASYSYRLQQNYSAHADAFAPMFGAERSDIPIEIIPGLGHTETSVMPEALSAFVEAL